MRTNKIREKWDADAPILNGWLTISNGFSAEVMAHQGYDTLTVDLQHGVNDEMNLIAMLQAISTTETVPIIRVPWLEPGTIMKALDMGAYGVICPMINTAEDAKKFVEYTSYAPMGRRSFGPVRAVIYGGNDYPDHANDTIVRFAMIETAEALDNLDAILGVEGLDAIYIGPSDLSLSLGCKPTFDAVEPPVAEAIDHILERATAYGLKAGIHNGTTAAARARIEKGFRFVTVSSDARIMATGSQSIVAEMRDLLAPKTLHSARYRALFLERGRCCWNFWINIMRASHFFLIFSSLLLLSRPVLGEWVEIHLIDSLDEDRGYCIDIKGYKSKAKIDRGLQAHTCYSYQGNIAVDQAFDSIRLSENRFYMPAFDVCVKAESMRLTASLKLKECRDDKLQKFRWDEKGRIYLKENPSLCITAAQGTPQKGEVVLQSI